MGIYGAGKANDLRYIQHQRPVNRHVNIQGGNNRTAVYYQPQQQIPMFGWQQPMQTTTQISYKQDDGGFLGGLVAGNAVGGLFDLLGAIFKKKESQGASDTPDNNNNNTVDNNNNNNNNSTPVEHDDGNHNEEPVVADDYTFSATARDDVTLNRYGIKFGSSNLTNGKAQWVQGNTGDVSITGDKSKPETITVKDSTNGQANTYTYQLLTPENIESGTVTIDGKTITLDKSQFQGDGPFYILASATNEGGVSIKRNHAEVYRLENPNPDGDKHFEYNLVQDAGMQGSGKSSVDPKSAGMNVNSDSGTAGGAGAPSASRSNINQRIKQEGWQRATAEQAKDAAQKFPAGTKAEDVVSQMGLDCLPSDLMELNPSVFDINTGLVKEGANWTKLDLPPKTE